MTAIAILQIFTVCMLVIVIRKLDLISEEQDNMSDAIKELNDKLDALKTNVDEYTTSQGERIAEAVAEARKAWDAESEDDLKAAMSKIDAIGAELKVFQPSAN